MQNKKVLSLGTMYLDINCINFPFDKGLFVHRETVGDEYQLDLGGSALNLAKIAAQLDMDISFLGKAGEDHIGMLLTTLLKQNNIKPLIIFGKNFQTNLAVHYIHEDGSSIMTSSGNANQSLSLNDIQTTLEENLGSFDYLYLGGVFKLKGLLGDLKSIAKKAQEKGLVVALDHGRVNNNVTDSDLEQIRELFPYIDIYLPSMDEFLTVWKATTSEEALGNLYQVATPTVVIKDAENGAVGFMNGELVKVDPLKVKVLNTVGAGDSFNAGFLKAHIDGKSFEESIQFACFVAATKISIHGKINLEKIEQVIEQATS